MSEEPKLTMEYHHPDPVQSALYAARGKKVAVLLKSGAKFAGRLTEMADGAITIEAKIVTYHEGHHVGTDTSTVLVSEIAGVTVEDRFKDR